MSQLPQRLGVLSGWGRTAPTASRVQQPRCTTQVAEALATGDAPGRRCAATTHPIPVGAYPGVVTGL